LRNVPWHKWAIMETPGLERGKDAKLGSHTAELRAELSVWSREFLRLARNVMLGLQRAIKAALWCS